VDTSDFDYELPPELIAQAPVEPRDRSRLMVIDRAGGVLSHRVFADLPELLRPGDCLVRNDSRVLPARLVGERERTGGRWEGLFLGVAADGGWECLATTRGKPVPGEWIRIDAGLRLELVAKGEGGRWRVRPEPAGSHVALLEAHGRVPLPPYIRKGVAAPDDRACYQTTYARESGSVAAPTAGLHFTPALFERLAARGVAVADVTLHVGIGTFRPIEAERVEDHVMHGEWARIDAAAVAAIDAARAAGGRVIAVGTTSVRTLETAAARGGGRVAPFEGVTDLYIRPGHAFRGLDGMITNFHLPRSSLIVLVAALAGLDLVRRAYDEAVRERYRFYSYGDAMLVVP
jgi:S-adenosylmethionine:tRNA ribosyltransferase-isomerase